MPAHKSEAMMPARAQAEEKFAALAVHQRDPADGDEEIDRRSE